MIKSIAARLCLTLVTTDAKILCVRQQQFKIFKKHFMTANNVFK